VVRLALILGLDVERRAVSGSQRHGHVLGNPTPLLVPLDGAGEQAADQ
jgi:hypothetical protein